MQMLLSTQSYLILVFTVSVSMDIVSSFVSLSSVIVDLWKRFDYIELAEAPFKNVAHCNDWQTFLMITPIPNSVLIVGLFFFWRPNFKLMLYSCICNMTVLCKCNKPYNDNINDMLGSNNQCSTGFTQWWR